MKKKNLIGRQKSYQEKGTRRYLIMRILYNSIKIVVTLAFPHSLPMHHPELFSEDQIKLCLLRHIVRQHTHIFLVFKSLFEKCFLYLGIACFEGEGVIAKIRPKRAKNGLRELKMDQKQTTIFVTKKFWIKGSTIRTKIVARREDLRLKPHV